MYKRLWACLALYDIRMENIYSYPCKVNNMPCDSHVVDLRDMYVTVCLHQINKMLTTESTLIQS